MQQVVVVAAVSALALLSLATALPTPSRTFFDCDVLVAGGSAASLAAAWAASERLAANSTVCLLDPTDWPGGQLTASLVTAIDFGYANNPAHAGFQKNLPQSFQDLLLSISGAFDRNVGDCWVSSQCYQALPLIREFIDKHMAKHLAKNLRLFLNTVVKSVELDDQGRIVTVNVVQRTPVPGTTGWERRLSDALTDWYSPDPSRYFEKQLFAFRGFRSVIEATEFGDVLMLASDRVGVAQGIEAPFENSTTFIDDCGQANTIDFYMELLQEPAKSPWVPPAGCPACNESRSSQDCCDYFISTPSRHETWSHIWTYRRSLAAGTSPSETTVQPGDISLQNWAAQDSLQYLFLPLDAARKQAQTDWMGGISLPALRASEDKAYGWFHYYHQRASEANPPITNPSQTLIMNRTMAGTQTGLAKMPYLRDTRRSLYGLNQFRLYDPVLMDLSNSSAPTGSHFHDTVGIGEYNVDIHVGDCAKPLPQYLNNHDHKPYYIPFRALTVQNSPTLLVAGKTMTQTFHANAATRLHPEEWVSGAAAGMAAALMVERGWLDTQTVYDHVDVLQEALLAAGQPLEWSGL